MRKRGGQRRIRLTSLYYRLRRRLGLAEIDPERRRKQKLLYPEKDADAAIMEEDEKRLRLGLLCVLGAAGLAVLSVWNQGAVTGSMILERPGYGEDTREISLNLEYDDNSWQIPLEIPGLVYTEEEWEQYRQEAWERVRQTALAGNEDWNHILTDLDFSEETGIPGITVEWNTGDPELISYTGEVGDLTEAEESRKVLLEATFRCGDREWTQELTAVVMPPSLSEEEYLYMELKSYLQSEVDGGNEADVELPDSFREKAILYLKEAPVSPWLLLALGGMSAAAFWILPEQRRRENEKKRTRELAMSYPELVSSLTVLMGAGLTVRGAWEKITDGYRESRARDGRRQVLYEEMLITWNSLGQGVYEEAAYVAFGRRCGLKPYLRLGSLLETNLKKGNRGLIPLLKEEAESAMEERLQLAKRLGEETSTRLLLPMLLLFALVLAILIIPAFWSL